MDCLRHQSLELTDGLKINRRHTGSGPFHYYYYTIPDLYYTQPIAHGKNESLATSIVLESEHQDDEVVITLDHSCDMLGHIDIPGGYSIVVYHGYFVHVRKDSLGNDMLDCVSLLMHRYHNACN